MAQSACRLCAPDTVVRAVDAERPLTIEIESGIDFSRVAVSENGGTIEVDPISGARRVSGGAVDLGGLAVSGTVRLSGAPGRAVRVTLPPVVLLSAGEGAVAELRDLRTDLTPGARLGPDGRLSFAFGGRLVVRGGGAGQLRGRIPIVADYE